MCFDMKNGKKKYFSGEIPVNDCRNVWRGLKSIRLIKNFFFTYLKSFMQRIIQKPILKGVLHLWALFLKILCIFSKNKATSDKVSYGSGQKCSKELENYSFTSVETIVVKLQWKMCENQHFPCFEP